MYTIYFLALISPNKKKLPVAYNAGDTIIIDCSLGYDDWHKNDSTKLIRVFENFMKLSES